MKMNKKSSYVVKRLLLVIIVLILGILALGIGLMVAMESWARVKIHGPSYLQQNGRN